jgi:hypothetical protein
MQVYKEHPFVSPRVGIESQFLLTLSISYPYRSPYYDVAGSYKGPIRTLTNHLQEAQHMAAYWDIYYPQLDYRTFYHARSGLGYTA